MYLQFRTWFSPIFCFNLKGRYCSGSTTALILRNFVIQDLNMSFVTYSPLSTGFSCYRSWSLSYLILKAWLFLRGIVISKLRWHRCFADSSPRGKDEGLVDGGEGIGGAGEPMAGGGGAGGGGRGDQHRDLTAGWHKTTVRHANAALFVTQDLQHFPHPKLPCCHTQKTELSSFCSRTKYSNKTMT